MAVGNHVGARKRLGLANTIRTHQSAESRRRATDRAAPPRLLRPDGRPRPRPAAGAVRLARRRRRIAVQVVLVIGGFLAAKSLSSNGHAAVRNPLGIMWRRYTKLAPPFVIATLLAAGASAWMTHDSIFSAPSVFQLAAHVLLWLCGRLPGGMARPAGTRSGR